MTPFSDGLRNFFERKMQGTLGLLALLLLPLPLLHANHGEDLTRIHCEVIGGLPRIEALKSIQARGLVSIGGKTLDTIVRASTPNRVKTEIIAGEYHMIQAYDGQHQPWQVNAALSHPIPRPIADNAAAEFIADSEFNDPLVNPNKRGIIVEYVGKINEDGRDYERLRILRQKADEQEIWLDARTYFIVRQIRQRLSGSGKATRMETRFSDFRPVAGVIMAHRITVYGNGKKLHETEFSEIQANPDIKETEYSMEAFIASRKQEN